MSTKTPFQKVKELYDSKEKLVDKVTSLLDPAEGESKEDFKARISRISNAKLMKVLETATQLKDKFGDKKKLVDQILKLMNRAKDKSFQEKLLSYSNGQLLDLYRRFGRAKKAA